MSIPHEQIDADAEKVVRRLTRSGYSAYLVGGCVRDLLLGRKPKDFDVATSATPTEIKALFRNCRIIGRRFRLAHVFFGPKIIETSTFRANPREAEPQEDGEAPATDGDELLIRRDNVFGTAEEDARRRDFTINGLFYDLEQDQVIDYVSGLPDLEARTVRTIGDPDIRFREDPVRILRAIKFAARLEFTIDPVAYDAILAHKGEISKCAPPRVLEEIYRLLRGGAAKRSLELLEDTGVLEVLIPQLAQVTQRSAADRNRLYTTMALLDERVRAGEVPSNALLLSALVAPLVVDVLYDAEGAPPEARVDVALVIWERARPLLESMRASRRDTELTRQILLAQRRIAPAKKRRVRPMALAKREWFPEALALFELMHPTPDASLAEEIQRWQRLLREGQHAEQRPAAPAEAAAGPAEPGRRRRRRRGGRRRRRGGGTTPPSDLGAGGTPSPESGGGTVAAAAPSDDPAEFWKD